MACARTAAVALNLPDGWSDRTVLTLVGPEVDGFAPNVVVTRERLCDHMGLGGFAAGWVNKLRDQIPVAEIRPVETIVIAGVRGQLRAVGWDGAGLDLIQLVGLFVRGEDAFAVVGTSAGDDIAEFEPVFRSMLADLSLAEAEVSGAAGSTR